MNERQRSPLRAHHLARRAIVYLRQSTTRQVEENEGSTLHQRNQAEYARELGWPPAAIEVIDDDLGFSGASTHRRLGYKRMLDTPSPQWGFWHTIGTQNKRAARSGSLST